MPFPALTPNTPPAELPQPPTRLGGWCTSALLSLAEAYSVLTLSQIDTPLDKDELEESGTHWYALRHHEHFMV